MFSGTELPLRSGSFANPEEKTAISLVFFFFFFFFFVLRQKEEKWFSVLAQNCKAEIMVPLPLLLQKEEIIAFHSPSSM